MIIEIVCFSVGTFFGLTLASLCVVASDSDDEMDKMQK